MKSEKDWLAFEYPALDLEDKLFLLALGGTLAFGFGMFIVSVIMYWL